MIKHSKPSLAKEEFFAVKKVLESGMISQGQKGDLLCKKLSQISRKSKVILTNSGTSALYLALVGLDVRKGHEVIIPAYVCDALLKAVEMVGAQPKIVDVCLSDFNISSVAVAQVINKKTKAIIVPHMYGQMAEMHALKKISEKFNVPIIEDCAMSVGASFNKKLAGNFGDIVVYSFYATKIITGGCGGAVATSLVGLDKKIKLQKQKLNLELSDINSAIVLEQIKKLRKFISVRKSLAKKYFVALKNTDYVLPKTYLHKDHLFYRFCIRTKHAKKLRKYLLAKGIETGFGVKQVLHKVYGQPKTLPNAEELLKTTVSIPIYPLLTKTEQNYIIEHLLKFDAKN